MAGRLSHRLNGGCGSSTQDPRTAEVNHTPPLLPSSRPKRMLLGDPQNELCERILQCNTDPSPAPRQRIFHFPRFVWVKQILPMPHPSNNAVTASLQTLTGANNWLGTVAAFEINTTAAGRAGARPWSLWWYYQVICFFFAWPVNGSVHRCFGSIHRCFELFCCCVGKDEDRSGTWRSWWWGGG